MTRALLAVVLLASACGGMESDAREALEAEGFTDYTLTVWEPIACGGDSMRSTGFRAQCPKHDHEVSGVVCCGVVTPGCVVRYNPGAVP